MLLPADRPFHHFETVAESPEAFLVDTLASASKDLQSLP